MNLFNEASARYLIVGGYAVIEHTEPRYTKDLDIWVGTDPKNALKIYSSLKKFGAPLSGITATDFATPHVVYQMGIAPVRIDIITTLEGLDFDQCWHMRHESSYGDAQARFISLDHLILNKKTAGRPQDLVDVENLLLAKKLKDKD